LSLVNIWNTNAEHEVMARPDLRLENLEQIKYLRNIECGSTWIIGIPASWINSMDDPGHGRDESMEPPTSHPVGA
jgi:hypothetical protein